jgi:hypothetical protein
MVRRDQFARRVRRTPFRLGHLLLHALGTIMRSTFAFWVWREAEQALRAVEYELCMRGTNPSCDASELRRLKDSAAELRLAEQALFALYVSLVKKDALAACWPRVRRAQAPADLGPNNE